jgi:hypothetical protein
MSSKELTLFSESSHALTESKIYAFNGDSPVRNVHRKMNIVELVNFCAGQTLNCMFDVIEKKKAASVSKMR